MSGLQHSASRLSVLAVLTLAAVLMVREIGPLLAESPPDTPEVITIQHGNDPRYFQAYPGGSSAMIRPEDIIAQVKRVAAARGITADSVRQMVKAQGSTV